MQFYYGGDPTAQEERRDKFEEWRDGKHTCIVATSAFGQGIDYPSVTLLIHCGMPWDMESFVQESGRAGRDGSAARCNLFTTNKTTTQTAFEDEGNRALHAMVYNSQHCRRLAISQYMDGVGVECIALPGSELCDVCQERMTTFAATTVAPRIPLPKAPEGSKPIEPASVAPIQAQDMLQPPTSSSWPAAPTTASPRPSSLPAHQQMRRTQGQQNHALANQLERIRSACMICYGVSGCNDASLPSIQHSYTQCKVNRLQARHVFAIKKQIQYSNARNMCFRCSTTSALCGADRGHRFQDMAIPLLLAVAEDPDRLAHYARRMGCALPGHNGMPEWLGATMRDEHGRDSTRAAVFLSLVLAE